MPHVHLENVSLTFNVRQCYQITLKEYLLRRMYRQDRNPLTEVRALQNVSLSFGEGDRVGVVGRNGSGKSTLLRLLAGVYNPTGGSREVEGRISSLFELGLGFEMEATGWDNIRYRGYLQGESPSTMREKMHEIAAFSELGRYLELPVRFYSAGMMVRLAFSIATTMDPEILLVDEVLSAGDLAFQEKAQRRMRSMMSRAKIIIAVSHDLESLCRFCEKGVWLDQGHVRMMGPIEDVIHEYRHYRPEPNSEQEAVAALDNNIQQEHSPELAALVE